MNSNFIGFMFELVVLLGWCSDTYVCMYVCAYICIHTFLSQYQSPFISTKINLCLYFVCVIFTLTVRKYYYKV